MLFCIGKLELRNVKTNLSIHYIIGIGHAGGLESTSRPGRYVLHAECTDARGGHPDIQATPGLKGSSRCGIDLDRYGHQEPECAQHQGAQQLRPESVHA